MAVPYRIPEQWLRYDGRALIGELAEAKAAVMSLTAMPFQRSWAEALQKIQLKQEAAGTSRIEGAEFTEKELDAALRDETPEATLTRSQRQARAAVNTYRWIAKLPADRPITADLIREIHRRIVTGCDDDHCPPGQLRSAGNNVTFGTPAIVARKADANARLPSDGWEKPSNASFVTMISSFRDWGFTSISEPCIRSWMVTDGRRAPRKLCSCNGPD